MRANTLAAKEIDRSLEMNGEAFRLRFVVAGSMKKERTL
jgi:hypothetical protein